MLTGFNRYVSGGVVFVIALGANELSAQTDNEILGTGTGVNISSGDNNTLIGDGTGTQLTSGSNNTMIGRGAGVVHNVSEAVFIGTEAGAANTTGFDSTFIGHQAGANNTTAGDNTFVGTESGELNTSGYDNTFVGEESGANNTTGYENTFIGEDSGFANTTGFKNTAVGNETMSGGAGNFNTAIGNEAGNNFETGNRNTALGSVAGGDIGAGNANTMIGANAGATTEHADFNTFVGYQAGADNNRTNSTLNANRNTSLGAFAGSANRVGEDNVWVGALADAGRWEFNQASEDAFVAGNTNAGLVAGPVTSNDSFMTLIDQSVDRTTVVGANAGAIGDDATVFGYRAFAQGFGGIAIGARAEAPFNNSIAIGYGAVTKNVGTVVIGNDTTFSWAPNADSFTSLGTVQYRFSDVLAHTMSVHADEDSAATLKFFADDSTDQADRWRVSAADSGALTIESEASGSSVPVLTAYNNGDVSVAGDVIVQSDARLKTDITEIADALALLEQVQGYRYRWRDPALKGDAAHVGFLAQEIEAVLPELVSADAQGVLSVNYQGVVPVLTNALREVHQISVAQQAEVNALKATVAKQQAMLEQVMAMLEHEFGAQAEPRLVSSPAAPSALSVGGATAGR